MNADNPSDLTPGTIIEGRYRLSQLVNAQGGTAVYTATHLLMGRNVTLEILSSHGDRAQRRFRRAGRVVSLMRHPNVVGIHDMGMFGDYPYMVLEYLDGQTLAQRITLRGLIEVPVALELAEQLLSALTYLHERKVIHRDIAAHNLVLTETWDGFESLKVTSFAFAKDLATSRSSSMSDKRTLMASLTHVAPEQILQPDEADHRVDIYAAGAVLYQALCGVAPFQGASLAELGRAILEAPPPPLSSWAEHLPSQLDEVLQQALAKKPEHRFDSASAMLRALRASVDPQPSTRRP